MFKVILAELLVFLLEIYEYPQTGCPSLSGELTTLPIFRHWYMEVRLLTFVRDGLGILQ